MPRTVRHSRVETPGSVVYETLRRLPKVDLHRHMEGSLRLDTLAEVAREHGVDLPSYDIEELRPYVQFTDDVPDFHVFMSKMELLRRFYSAAEAVDRIAYEAVVDAAHDNVHYLELRFSPAGKHLSSETVMSHVVNGVQRASHEHAIQVRLVVTIVREFGLEVAEEVLELAAAYRDRGVVGLDLAGHEENYGAAAFTSIFRRAREAGLQVTIHAGEVGGPDNVREAIEVLDAQRIGHGVRAIEDREVVQLLRERGVPLEICLTSNLQTGATKAFTRHPLRELFHFGVQTTINTDDPSISDTTLTDEYNVAVETLGISLNEIQQMILNSARAAFLPPEEKQDLIQQLDAQFAP